MRDLNYEGGRRYSAHAFRRGSGARDHKLSAYLIDHSEIRIMGRGIHAPH